MCFAPPHPHPSCPRPGRDESMTFRPGPRKQCETRSKRFEFEGGKTRQVFDRPTRQIHARPLLDVAVRST